MRNVFHSKDPLSWLKDYIAPRPQHRNAISSLTLSFLLILIFFALFPFPVDQLPYG